MITQAQKISQVAAAMAVSNYGHEGNLPSDYLNDHVPASWERLYAEGNLPSDYLNDHVPGGWG